MALKVRSVLVTGANRGIGLELIKQFANLPSPPEFIFAGCRSPDSAKVSRSNVSICFLTIFQSIFAVNADSSLHQEGR